jgi:hypothetical protein
MLLHIMHLRLNRSSSPTGSKRAPAIQTMTSKNWVIPGQRNTHYFRESVGQHVLTQEQQKNRHFQQGYHWQDDLRPHAEITPWDNVSCLWSLATHF